MISDDFLDNLPETPELAAVQIAYQLQAAMAKALDDLGQEPNAYHVRMVERKYCADLLGAWSALEIQALADWEIPGHGSEFDSWFVSFQTAVSHYMMGARVKSSRQRRRFSVALGAAERSKIRHHLGQIKEIVEGLDISLSRREALISKINALNEEVDRERSRWEAISDAWLTFCDKTAEGFEKLEPARKFFETIGGVFGAAKTKEDEDQKQLPRPTETKRIEPPKKMNSVDPDDEIPF